MVDEGITVVTPNGNTSEFYSLTVEECNQAVLASIAGVEGRAVVMPGVGHDLATALELGRFAAGAGADALMIHTPSHPIQSQQGWLDYHRAIADAFPDLGIVPYVRGELVSDAMLIELAAACPNFVGVKYAPVDPKRFAATIRTVGQERVTWICGTAESWAPFFWVGGAQGFTSGLVNIIVKPSIRMLEALRAGDYATAMGVWDLLYPFEEMRARHRGANNVSAVKEGLAQMGLCRRTVRSPITEIVESERLEVTQILENWGLPIHQPIGAD
jgi:4-hydroxy-tetrahydrodipicolinate synthase